MASTISKSPAGRNRNRSPNKPKSKWGFLSRLGQQKTHRLSNDQALQRAIVLLLETIETYAIPSDDLNHSQFCSYIRDIAGQFSSDLDTDDALIAVDRACNALKLYFRRTGQFIAGRREEYQKIVSMFTETVASLSASGEHSVVRLKDIEKQIETSTLVEDIRAHRLRLGQILDAIHKEIDRQEAVSADVRHAIEKNIAHDKRSEYRSGPADSGQDPEHELTYDPVSGLPARKLAESALLEALKSEDSYYVVPIVAKGVDVIYARLGADVGDSALYHFAERMCSYFGEDTPLFRWRGTSFVALLRRPATLTKVRAELAGIAATRLDDAIRVGVRLLWLPMSASWEVIAVTPPYYSLALKIDQFIAAQASYN